MNTTTKALIFSLLLTSPVNAGVDFDNVDDLVSCGSAATLDNMTALTYAAWIKADTFDSEMGIVYKVATTTGKFFYAANGGTGSITMGIDRTGGGSSDALSVSANSTITTGRWWFVATTWTSGSAPQLYVGSTTTAVVEVSYASQTAGAGTIAADATGNLSIGSRASSNQNLDGQIAEVAVWNTALSLAQLQMIGDSKVKRMALQVAPSNLVAYYSLDDDIDGTAAHGQTFRDYKASNTCTADDGANNTGMLAVADNILSYP